MASPFIELEVGTRVVKVTNPQKVLFPARQETKLDLVEYYVSVGEGIVRALYERPTQLRRFPDGVDALIADRAAVEKVFLHPEPMGETVPHLVGAPHRDCLSRA